MTINHHSPTIAPEMRPVVNDPLNVRVHTLDNGLTLYLSVNKNEPRIYTHIVVRAGSKQDPAETTGLAHYLEHMMFKGTSRIGALDWEREKLFLDRIAALYEAHKNSNDPDERRRLYAEIDAASNEAAALVAANEYDKLVSVLGARNTNAYTSNDQTVYVNEIPSNEIKKWFQLESERFKMVVLRLFHTELETVYEEFNMGQDNDGRKAYAALMEGLFPTHPYGTQTTIGKGEHLKSPSHYNIINYFKSYYVPNNMALILSGDFDPDEIIALAETHFGGYAPSELPPFKVAPLEPQKDVVRKEVLGRQAPYVYIGWRLAGSSSADNDYTTLISGLLSNNQAGLIDLDLLQKQRVLSAGASDMQLADYGAFMLYGRPRENQSLEEVEKLLVEQVNRIKKGDFPEWLLQAVLKDYKYSQMKSYESNRDRVAAMTEAFVLGLPWPHYVGQLERLGNITRADLMDFANTHFKDNYVVVYKRTGDDPQVMKVEKPTITPVTLNRQDASGFATDLTAKESPRLTPEFVDYSQIQSKTLKNGLKIDFVANTINETFLFRYKIDINRAANPTMALALSYLPYLGTDKYTAAQLEQEFYRLGLVFEVFPSADHCIIQLKGLEESFTEGVALVEHIMQSVRPDEKAWVNLVADILSSRDIRKKDKSAILQSAMANYAKYGPVSPETDILSKKDLEAIKPATLVDNIKKLLSFEHDVFYYGTRPLDDVAAIVAKEHSVPKKFLPPLPKKEYKTREITADNVLFVHFPMVQTEVMMLAPGVQQFSKEAFILSQLYNTYFGYGLSSIVFQEIREARALAYSAYAYYSSPDKAKDGHWFVSYVGTQADKLKEAVSAMRQITEDMPLSSTQIEQARQLVLKKIESQRVSGASIYFNRQEMAQLGLDYDIKKDIYQSLLKTTASDLKAFHESFIAKKPYTILVLGDRDRLDMDYLKTLGPVKELTMADIFGY